VQPKVLEEYQVAGATVKIIEDEEGGVYQVEEPSLTQEELKIEEESMEEVYRFDVNDVEEALLRAVVKRSKDPKSVEKIVYDLRSKTFYGKITVPMLDPDIEEVECAGPGRPVTVIHRRHWRLGRLRTNIIFSEDMEILRLIQRAAARVDRSVSLARPYVEISLPEGHRLSATISSEISIPGTTFDVRKFPQEPMTIGRLVKEGTVTPLQVAYLWYLMEFKPFMIILGSTGSGKTTLLNGLLNLLDSRLKIVTIEETPEVNLSTDNWVRLISRDSSDQYRVTLAELARLALRYRPDFLVIGEVRGREIEALVHASASGHGSLTTFHGARPADAVTRILDLLPKEVATIFLQNVWVMPVMTNNNGRRLSKIYEATRFNGKVKFLEVMDESVTDVSTLTNVSPRLKWITKNMNLTVAQVEDEISFREEIISSMVQRNLMDQTSVSRYLRQEMGRRNEVKVLRTA